MVPEEEVCYWKDMTLRPHLLNLLGKRSVCASVCFAPTSSHPDRKVLAQMLHNQVIRLKGLAGQSLVGAPGTAVFTEVEQD